MGRHDVDPKPLEIDCEHFDPSSITFDAGGHLGEPLWNRICTVLSASACIGADGPASFWFAGFMYTRPIRAVAILSALAVVALAEPARPLLSPTNIFAPVSTPAQSIFDLSRFVLMVTGSDLHSSLSFCLPMRSLSSGRRESQRVARACASLRKHSIGTCVDGDSDPHCCGPFPCGSARNRNHSERRAAQ